WGRAASGRNRCGSTTSDISANMTPVASARQRLPTEGDGCVYGSVQGPRSRGDCTRRNRRTDMRRTLIHAITLAASAAITVPAAADAQQRPEGRAFGGAPVERLIEQREKLGLTDQQVEQLRRIGA